MIGRKKENKELKAGAKPSFVHSTYPHNACLHYAALNGNIDLCRQLLNAKAEPNEKNSNGHTPFDLALGKKPLGVRLRTCN